MRRYLLSLLLFFFLSGCSESPQLDTLSSEAVILAFGDSLTFGTGAKPEQSYPSVLAKLTKLEVINEGIPGEVSAKGLKRLPGLLEKHEPDLLILCHGGNDILQRKSKDTMFKNVQKMIELAKAKNVDVVLLGVPEFGLFLSSMEGYAEIAEATDSVYISDLIPDLLSDNSLKSDNVHPNKAGYKLMAEEIYETLQKSGAL